MSAYDRIYHPSDISNSDEENSQREMSDVHQSAWHTENIERQNETPSVTVQSNLNERIKRIQNSIDKAQSMLDTVEKNNNMRTDGHEQREKLRSILFNLKAQKLSYLKLLNSDEDKKTVLTCRHVELPLTQSSSEENLLSDINKLRDRLKLLRFLYEQKQNQADKQIPANLDEIRQQLNELEEMVNETSNFFVSSTSAISQENKNNFQHPTIDSTHQINTSESTHNDPSDTDQFTSQLRNLSHCLFMFIEEQKKFNHQIEERLLVSIKPSTRSNSNQALLADLETAYRQITVLQSEINALQSENTRLLSSLSFEQQYHHCSKNSLKYASGNLRTTDEQKLPSSRTPLSKSHDRELREFPVVKVNSEEIRCQNQNQQRLSMESIGLPRPIPVQTKYPLVETKTTSKSDSTAIEVSTKIDIQLLSFLRLHLNEKFNKYLLDLIRDQTFCLIKDQIGLTSSIELNIEQMFSNKLNKYLGLSVRKQGITFLGDLSQIVQQILLGNFQRNEQNQSERMGFDPDILTSLNPSAEPNFNRHEYIFVH